MYFFRFKLSFSSLYLIDEDLQKSAFFERLPSLFEEDLIMYLRNAITNAKSLNFFMPQFFQSKIRLLIITTFYVHISTVKFASSFKESPCSPVVTFPSFGSEGYGVQPPQGDSFFHILCWNFLMFFRTIFFLHELKT